MGARQVPGAALAAWLALPGAAAAQPPAGNAGEPLERRDTVQETAIGIIDLGRGGETARQARRVELENALAQVPGVRLIGDAELRQTLAGQVSDPQIAAGWDALARAQAAFGGLDCRGARSEADRAVLALAAAQAAGAGVDDELRRAHSIRLLCADQGGDRGAAQSAADALRQLGASDPPDGIGDSVWSRYPAVDAATGVQKARLAITTEPAGAAIWIDHAIAGAAPLTVSVAEGEHLVAAALPSGGSTAQRVSVSSGWVPASLALVVPAAARSRWRAVEERVQGWRRGAGRPDPTSVGQLLAAAGLSAAVVIVPGGTLAVWYLVPGRGSARYLGSAAGAAEVGTLIAGVRSGPGIDPNRPLLRETPEEREAARGGGRRGKREEWWVYAAIIGAVAIGAGFVLAQDLGTDQQRIEITFP